MVLVEGLGYLSSHNAKNQKKVLVDRTQMAIFSALQGLLTPPPPSLYVTTMTVASIIYPAYMGINEFTGKKSLQYSKLANTNNQRIPSKIGMLMFYTPAFVCSLASFFFFHYSSIPDGGGDLTRFLLIRTALTLHFLKRIIEVLFIHKFSGRMTTEAAITVSLGYLTGTFTMIYAQYLSLQLAPPPPFVDLKYFGVAIFLIGIVGNLYHHYILSNLRRKGEEKEYKIPKSGLFEFVICPHYFFEVLGYWGLTLICQTMYALSFAIGTSFYMMGRSVATRRWYASKFEDFPRDVKSIIPFLF